MFSFQKLSRSIRKRLAPTPTEIAIKRWRKGQCEERLRYDYPLDAQSRVLDLGGYQGNWTDGIYRRYHAKVDVFEPVPSFAQQIESRFTGNPDIRVHACGLGRGTRSEQIAVCCDSSSVHRTSSSTVPIRIVDVHEWFDRENLQSVDLMKINIEGGEYELLERMLDTGLVSRVKNIQVQFHDLAGDSAVRMQAIQSRLAQTHQLTYQFFFVWENWCRR